MDWGSLTGLILGISAILFGQWLEGGHIGSLIQPAAFVIVVGSTFGAVLLQNGYSNLMRGIHMLGTAFVPHTDFYPVLIASISNWSKTARIEGFLKLEKSIGNESDAFIARGLHMVVDGVDPYKIREILEIDISSYERNQRMAIKVWEAAGGYAPTMGIMGAVLGLIHIMENLTDPHMLGQGVATAFVSTIYGVGFSNLVFLPVANKLKQYIQLEILKREMLCEAFVCIKQGEHPHLILERMNSYWYKNEEHHKP
jgi:chemotaxis protein MotA